MEPAKVTNIQRRRSLKGGASIKLKFAASLLILLCAFLPVSHLTVGAAGSADPLYARQWHHAVIGPEAGWIQLASLIGSTAPQPVTVALIDSGVDASHPDLQGRLWSGINLITGADPNDLQDQSLDGHGTHAAGLIVALAGNNLGGAGVVGPLPIKLLPIKILDADSSGSFADLERAIRWAVDWKGPDGERVRVINLSLGQRLARFPTDLADAVQYAVKAGVLIIAAAGNDGGQLEGFYPASLSGLLSVGSTRAGHTQAVRSNQGALLLAPGDQILSTLPGDRYGLLSGTSSAAPLISGIAGALWSLMPDRTWIEMMLALLGSHTTRPCGPTGQDNCPVVSAERAIANLIVSRPPPAAPEDLQGTAFAPTRALLTWNRPLGHPVRGYEVIAITTDGERSLLRFTAGTEALLQGLQPGQAYRFAVVAVDTVGNRSDPSEVALTTPGAMIRWPSHLPALQFP